MQIGSLFSGIGGLECGLELCGLGPVIWQAENDPYALAVLKKYWPTVKRYEDVHEIDNDAERPGVICGGFPCQDISNAGNRKGIGGSRSGLWFEYARIVGLLRPNFVFVENVAALTNRGLDTVLGTLAEIGYNAEWDHFRASDVGSSQGRNRIFILAYAEGVQFQGISHTGVNRSRYQGARTLPGQSEILAEVVSVRKPRIKTLRKFVADSESVGRSERRSESNGKRKAVVSESRGREVEFREHRFPPGPDEIAGWEGPKPAVRRGPNGIPGRVDRLRCLGNAVVPQVAALAWETLIARISDLQGG